MKTLFVPATTRQELDKSKLKEITKKLPKNIALCYSIQFKNLAEELKSQLKQKNITSFIQVLGCSKPKFPQNTDAVLLIGSGKFHAVSLAYESKLPVYVFESNTLSKISNKEIEKLAKQKKASYVRFLNFKKVGVLVSTKPGQQNLKKALDFKKTLKNKKSYLFLSNNISTAEFENFGLKSWVNTACPRIDLDNSAVINIRDLNTRNSKNCF